MKENFLHFLKKEARKLKDREKTAIREMSVSSEKDAGLLMSSLFSLAKKFNIDVEIRFAQHFHKWRESLLRDGLPADESKKYEAARRESRDTIRAERKKNNRFLKKFFISLCTRLAGYTEYILSIVRESIRGKLTEAKCENILAYLSAYRIAALQS